MEKEAAEMEEKSAEFHEKAEKTTLYHVLEISG